MSLKQSPNNKGSGMVAIPKKHKHSLHIYVRHLSAKILDMEKYLEHPNFSILGPCSRLAVYVLCTPNAGRNRLFQRFSCQKAEKRKKCENWCKIDQKKLVCLKPRKPMSED